MDQIRWMETLVIYFREFRHHLYINDYGHYFHQKKNPLINLEKNSCKIRIQGNLHMIFAFVLKKDGLI